MEITRTSILSGVTRTKNIDVTMNQLQKWSEGANIQDVMGNLADFEREFIMTGITEEEWNDTFGEEELIDIEILDDSADTTGWI